MSQGAFYTYVLVRTDLPLADQMVQACHASLEAGSAFPQPDAPSHIALLAVTSEAELLIWRNRLADCGVRLVVFYEPDPILDGDAEPMGDTALATEPLGSADPRRKILRRLKLWSAAS